MIQTSSKTEASRLSAEDTYRRAVSRFVELEGLNEMMRVHKAALVYGAEGVGKTRLLREFVSNTTKSIYTARTSSPSELLEALAEQMAAHSLLPTRKMHKFKSTGAVSHKGIVQSVLSSHPCILVLDQVCAPSNALCRLIKDLHYMGRTPVIIGARSPHMEDVGTLLPLFALHTQQLLLKEWPFDLARQFAEEQATKDNLQADRLGEVLDTIVHHAQGRPGAIAAMVRMANYPRYRLDTAVKVHVLYLDFRMGQLPIE